MDSVQYCVKISGASSDLLETRKTLRLFNIALEGVLKRAGLNTRITIFNKSSLFIYFADDVDIVGRTFQVDAEQYTRLQREEERVGLKVNTSKTKCLLSGGTARDRARIGIRVMIDGNS